jgi:formylglycine-generating enzyme required for sulfatase activity
MFESLEARRRQRKLPILAILGAVVVTLGGLAYCIHEHDARERDETHQLYENLDHLAPPAPVREAKPQLPPNHTPRPACPAGMIGIPGGSFYIGNSTDSREAPIHEVALASFCIDRTEVTVEAYSACVASRACEPAGTEVTRGAMTDRQVALESPTCNGTRSDRNQHPINCVDWNQAAAYCAWAKARLPTEAEWEYAAIGTEDRIFPWGNEPPGDKRFSGCGAECKAFIDDVTQTQMEPLYDRDDGWPTTAPIGSFPDDTSAFGVLDMAGNVCEWVSDWYGPYSAGAVTDPKGPPTGHERVQRGGSWADPAKGGPRAAMRGTREPKTRGMAVGFRCASSVR